MKIGRLIITAIIAACAGAPANSEPQKDFELAIFCGLMMTEDYAKVAAPGSSKGERLRYFSIAFHPPTGNEEAGKVDVSNIVLDDPFSLFEGRQISEFMLTRNPNLIWITNASGDLDRTVSSSIVGEMKERPPWRVDRLYLGPTGLEKMTTTDKGLCFVETIDRLDQTIADFTERFREEK